MANQHIFCFLMLLGLLGSGCRKNCNNANGLVSSSTQDAQRTYHTHKHLITSMTETFTQAGSGVPSTSSRDVHFTYNSKNLLTKVAFDDSDLQYECTYSGKKLVSVVEVGFSEFRYTYITDTTIHIDYYSLNTLHSQYDITLDNRGNWKYMKTYDYDEDSMKFTLSSEIFKTFDNHPNPFCFIPYGIFRFGENSPNNVLSNTTIRHKSYYPPPPVTQKRTFEYQYNDNGSPVSTTIYDETENHYYNETYEYDCR